VAGRERAHRSDQESDISPHEAALYEVAFDDGGTTERPLGLSRDELMRLSKAGEEEPPEYCGDPNCWVCWERGVLPV
jgi:hypothetical protein